MFKLNYVIAFCILTMMIISPAVGRVFAQTAEEDVMKKGVDLVRHDRFDEALLEFNKVLATNPGSASAYYNLGFAYDKKGDPGKAITNFSKAIEIDPTLTDAYYNRGFAYYKKGAFDNAITDYNKVIGMSPESADAYYGLGLVYSKRGDLDKAIDEYTKAIKIRPGFALAYDARAVAYVTKKNYIMAMADVNKAQSLGFRSRPLKQSLAISANAGKSAVGTTGSEPARDKQARSMALIVAGAAFLLVSILHLLRMLLRIKVIVGNFMIPTWVSLIGFMIPLTLSAWMFISAK